MSGSRLDFFFSYALTNSNIKEHILAVTETAPKLLPQIVKLIQKLSVVNYEIILPIWSALVLQFGLLKISCRKMDTVEGQITDFCSYTFLEITKKSHTKITKSQRNHIQKAPKSQITEKLLKNHMKKSLESTRITRKSQKKIM